jgi:rubrerythrin
VERRAFLATLGALAVAGCGGGGAKTTTSKGVSGGGRLPGAPDDAGVLGFVLGLEQLQLDLYRRAQTSSFFPRAQVTLLQALAEQEAGHVAKLIAELKRLKAAVPKAPALNVALADGHTMLTIAYRLENLTAAAYLGQVARIRDTGVLRTVLSIQTVEGRHAAAIGALLGKTATPDGAFAAGHNMATIALVRGELAR